jgi:hypothetical protein
MTITEVALDSRTIDVFKTFATINQGLVVEPGNVSRTSTARGTTMAARVTVPVSFPAPFAVWDLNRFLVALDTFKRPRLMFLNKGQVGIREDKGLADVIGITDEKPGLTLRYPLAKPEYIDPFHEFSTVEPTLAFSLSGERLRLFIELGRKLNLPHLILSGDGSQLLLTAADASKPEGIQVGGEMAIGKTDKQFRLIWAAEDWRKVLHDDYKVGIAFAPSGNEGFAHFVSTDGNAHFWLLTRTVGDKIFEGRKAK